MHGNWWHTLQSCSTIGYLRMKWIQVLDDKNGPTFFSKYFFEHDGEFILGINILGNIVLCFCQPSQAKSKPGNKLKLPSGSSGRLFYNMILTICHQCRA